MKFTDQTRNILKNFCSINESIILREGSTINTTSNVGNIMAVAELDTAFPSEAYIYNLNEFLNTLSLFDDPDVVFKDTHFVITDSNSSMTYYFADASLINIPNKTPDASKLDEEMSFVITEEALADLIKASNVMNLPDLVLTNKDGDMYFQVTDHKNPTSNTYGKSLGSSNVDNDYSLFFKSENIRLSKGDYKFTIYSRNGKFISFIEHMNHELSYWVALEASSEIKD